MLRFLRKHSFVILLTFVAFAFGIATHKYDYFPYPHVRDVAKFAIFKIKRWLARPEEVLARQYTQDHERIPLGKDIDTELLPLKLRGVRLSEHLPVPKAAGGITTIGNSIVVLDRLANLYSCDPESGRVEKLPFPPIPNNIKDYLRSALVLSDNAQRATLTDATFRAYGVAYMTQPRRLAVSHEYFDKQQGQSQLAVSIIEIDENSISPRGPWKTIFLSDPLPRIPATNGGGKLIASGADRIYLALGDHYLAKAAQDQKSKFGKILEITVSTRQHKILSMGHRNPQGITEVAPEIQTAR